MLSDRCPVCPVCLSVIPVCDVGALWPNGWMVQDETWYAGSPRPWPHCVRRGPSSPYSKGRSPNFRPIPVAIGGFWATVCKTKQFAPCYRSVVCMSCLSVCDVGVLWPNRWTDQDETWHAGRPRPWPHRVRWGPTSPSPGGPQPPIFGPYLLLPNGCMDQDVCRPMYVCMSLL